MKGLFFYSRWIKRNCKKYRILYILILFTFLLGLFYLIDNDNTFGVTYYQISVNGRLPKLIRARNNHQNMSLHDPANVESSQYDRSSDAVNESDIQSKNLTEYPQCLSRTEWLRKNWKNHSCFAEFGVNGSEFSFIRYLSEVENLCPIMDDRKLVKRSKIAQITREFEGLHDILPSSVQHSASHSFMHARLKRMWPDWLAGIQHYINGVNTSWPDSQDPCKHCSSDDVTCFTLCHSTKLTGQPFLFGRPRLNILVHLEFLSNGVGGNYFETVTSKGGPLGELVQWTDLIGALYILGHTLTITYEASKARLLLSNSDSIPCKVKTTEYDLIYTDIPGFRQLSRSEIRESTCKFRILDTFGTEATYNRNEERWGGLHLNLQQFYTFFPHTPDNTFLGFVTEIFPFKSNTTNQSLSKPFAIVYGKEAYMWKNKTNYLRILSDYFELHGNVLDKIDKLPDFVHIHQLQYGQPYLELLSKAQVMIGLGFPYEGPAPLEAIANGLIFLNPRFSPPHSRTTESFFSDKPTSRGLTSQHPYIENHISEPYSYLIDMGNETQIRQTVQRILTTIKKGSYRPHEYSPWGFFERLNAYLTRQNICSTPFYNKLIQSPLPVPVSDGSEKFNYMDASDTSVTWPPASSLRIVLGSSGKSCSEVCMSLKTSGNTFAGHPDISAHSIHDIPQHPQIQNGYLYYRSIHATPSPNVSYLYTFRCSPEHFPSINNRLNLQRFGISCPNITYSTSPMAPYWDDASSSCVFQASHEWFDCTASGTMNESHVFSRFCPCRDALPNQISLCSNCL
ncbi:unnamed protein product [Schistosoma turkestanicum]|nr:unnamed protein product [Schistosoma turkestanicum]